MHGLNITILPDGRRAIIIRTSDRIAFKQCRRKWAWSSHLKANLGPKNLAAPLWFGSAIHYALEDFHGNKMFDTAADAFAAYCIATSHNYKRELPPDAQEHYTLGRELMNYYENYWLKAYGRKADETYWCLDPNGVMEPQVEVNFEIPIPVEPGSVVAQHLERLGVDIVLYRGTIDRVCVDEFGHLWVCVAEDTLVGSTKGICKIQDHPDAKYNGIRQTVLVTTDSGYQVECTPDHQILTEAGWKEAQQLSTDDYLVLQDYSQYQKQDDPDYWWVAGFWYGDGSLRNHGRGSIDFSTGLDDAELQPILDRFFSSRKELTRYAANKNTTGYRYVTNQAEYADKLRELFATPWKTKYIKQDSLPVEKIGNLSSFLSGLFDADGSVGSNRAGLPLISYSTKHAQVASQVQQILAFFGIKSGRREAINGKYTWHTVTVSDKVSCSRFGQYIGFRLSRKQKPLLNLDLVDSRARGPKVTSVLQGREVPVYDLLDQPDNLFAAGGLTVHNCEYKTAKVAQNSHFQTDPQVTTYVWACSLIYDRPVAGVIYHQFVKKMPEPPRVLSSGKLSTAANLVTSSVLYRQQLMNMYGDYMKAPSVNQAKLNELMGAENGDRDRYIIRERIHRNAEQCFHEAQKILLELEDMLNPDLPLYPNPTRDCSRMCSFLTACVNMDDGSDWEAELAARYLPRDLDIDRLWRKRLPSPEKMLSYAQKREEPDLEGIQSDAQAMAEYEQAEIANGDFPTPEWQAKPDPFGGMNAKGGFNMSEVS